MSLLNKQNFLARLYTDENFRRRFLFEPEKLGRKNDLNENEIAEIAGIIHAELNFFADSLFWKRLREAEKFLPETKKVLGKDFTSLFRKFSQNYDPQTVKKHLEDAVEFCDFLAQNSKLSEQAKSTAKFEQSKLKFFGFGKRFVFCRLNNNLFSNQKSVSFWFRLKGKTYHCMF